MPTIKVDAFHPDVPVYWGAKIDTAMTADELRLALRYIIWRRGVEHEADNHMHAVLMNDVYGNGRRAQQNLQSEPTGRELPGRPSKARV